MNWRPFFRVAPDARSKVRLGATIGAIQHSYRSAISPRRAWAVARGAWVRRACPAGPSVRSLGQGRSGFTKSSMTFDTQTKGGPPAEAAEV
jgi:hypothetical protein